MKSAEDLETYLKTASITDVWVCKVLNIKKIQNKPIVRYHLFEWLLQTNKQQQKDIGSAEKQEPFYVTTETINWYRHYRRQHECSLKEEEKNYPVFQDFHFCIGT